MKFKGSEINFEVGQVYKISDVSKWEDIKVYDPNSGTPLEDESGEIPNFENGDFVWVAKEKLSHDYMFKSKKGESMYIKWLAQDKLWSDDCVELISGEGLLSKLENEEELTLTEVMVCIWACEVDRIEGKIAGIQYRTNQSVFELGDKLFLVTWEEGLTDSYEDVFYSQIAEQVAKIRVEKEIYQKVVK